MHAIKWNIKIHSKK